MPIVRRTDCTMKSATTLSGYDLESRSCTFNIEHNKTDFIFKSYSSAKIDFQWRRLFQIFSRTTTGPIYIEHKCNLICSIVFQVLQLIFV